MKRQDQIWGEGNDLGCRFTPSEILLQVGQLNPLIACRLTGLGGIQSSSDFPLISQVCLMLPLLTHFDGGLQNLRLRSNFVVALSLQLMDNCICLTGFVPLPPILHNQDSLSKHIADCYFMLKTF